MMNSLQKEELLTIMKKYSFLREEISSVESQLGQLSKYYEKLSKALNDTRDSEQTLINRIEQELDRKITQDELFEIANDFKLSQNDLLEKK